MTDWPALFAHQGFTIVASWDILANTMLTWQHARAVYEQRRAEVGRRYGRRIANRTCAWLDLIPNILLNYATFPVLSARK